MKGPNKSAPRVTESFQAASCAAPKARRKKTAAPFSLRLTADERAYLDRQAGSRPLGAYIRERVLGDRREKRRVVRKPKIDDQQIARILAELGRSRLASNLNQLAKAAHCGTLPVAEVVQQQLTEACQAVIAMRDALITALGLKAEAGPSPQPKSGGR